MSISFIVPVYNTKVSLLKRCVLSIEKLEVNDYEIIIVNDGSDDDKTRRYKDFLASRQNIIYIEHKNSGVSHSRNCGIREATKKYIAFVDSDDTVICGFFDNRNIELGEDIVLLTYYNRSTNKKCNYSFTPGLISRRTLLEEAVSTCNYCNPFAKLFKREYLINHNILFNESFVQGEDALFNLCCLEFNPTIRYYETLFYEYDYNDLSTENRWKNQFEKCLDNKYYIYARKQELIRNLCKPNERKELLIKNDNEFVKSVFHSYRFLIAISDSEKIKKYIDRFKRANLDKKVLGLKEKLYYESLLHDGIFTRKMISLMQKIK